MRVAEQRAPPFSPSPRVGGTQVSACFLPSVVIATLRSPFQQPILQGTRCLREPGAQALFCPVLVSWDPFPKGRTWFGDFSEHVPREDLGVAVHRTKSTKARGSVPTSRLRSQTTHSRPRRSILGLAAESRAQLARL